MSKPKTLKVSRTRNTHRKAFKAVFTLTDGKTRVVYFGTCSNFVLNPNKTERDRKAYIARHGSPNSGQNHNDPMTAGALSRHVLWGKSRSWQKNLAVFKQRFGLL